MSRFSPLIKPCTDKLVSQWVSHWVWLSQMHFYAILKNSGSQNIPLLFHPKWCSFAPVMFLCQSHLKDFVNYMNIKHPNIKFTSEFKENDFFFFSDVKITRRNNQLVTSVFRKATISGIFINFKSFIPVAYKFGLVYTLLHR